MKKMITKAILASLMAVQAQAAWMPTDGSLDFVCGDGKNIFTFTAFYNNQASGLELAYDISVTQFPFVGSELNPVAQAIPGCQEAPLEFSETANGAEVYFECAADGDAGFGTIEADFINLKMELDISFPEGQPTLLYPFLEDTNMKLSCDFK